MNCRRFIQTTLFCLVVVLLTSLLPVQPVQAAPLASGGEAAFPALVQFIRQVQNGEADELRGVYVPDLMAAGIVRQPGGHLEFIATQPGVLTNFDLPADFQATGLLAHNYLAGEKFPDLEPGRIFYLVYGDGRAARYAVREMQSYRALNPLSVTSSFVSLENGRLFSSAELFERVYDRPGEVIFQTCIARSGQDSWGRLFIIAEPLPAR